MSAQYGRKPIWCDPVEDLSVDSDDTDEPLPQPPPPAATTLLPSHQLPLPMSSNVAISSSKPRAYEPPPPPPQQSSGARPQPFRIFPGSSIVFQPDPSSTTSSSGEVSDSSDAGTDASSEHVNALLSASASGSGSAAVGVLTVLTAVDAVVPARILKRMSSVTLVEADATGANGRRVKPATSAAAKSSSTTNVAMSSGAGTDESEDKSPEPVRRTASMTSDKENRRAASLTGLDDNESNQYDTDDELRYVRDVEGASPIPINCMTQEKILHPRRRPVPSPATGMRGQQQHQQQQSGALEFSWKRFGRGLPAHETRSVDARSVPLKYERSESLVRTCGTLVVYQPTCLDHHNDTHQENRQRLSVLCGPDGVLHMDRFRDLAWANLNELKPARLNDLLRVHSFEYIQHLERACGRLPEQDDAISVGSLFAGHGSSADALTHSVWLKVGESGPIGWMDWRAKVLCVASLTVSLSPMSM